jgi:hypothetical protein
LYLVRDGRRESTRAFNTALAEFAAVDPKRLIVSYQIPIHDIDDAIIEVQWAAANGCKSLQLPVFPAELGLADYWDARYEPLFDAIQETGLPICCHIGMNTMLDDLAQRDPTPQKGIFVPMVPLGRRVARDVDWGGGSGSRDHRVRRARPRQPLLRRHRRRPATGRPRIPAVTELPSHGPERVPHLCRRARRADQARGRWPSRTGCGVDYPHP